MTEHIDAATSKTHEYNNPYEYDEHIQRALDAFVQQGAELSSQKFPSEEHAKEMQIIVDNRLASMGDNCVDVGRSMLRVSGQSALKLNYKITSVEGSEGLAFITEIDAKNPIRPLEIFEEQLFRARTITSARWRDEDAECWRVGIDIRGDDPENIFIKQIMDTSGYSLLTSQAHGSMRVRCNEFTQIEVDALARRRERDEAIASLRGRVDGGLVRMLKTIDQEMTRNISEDFVSLKNIHYLRLLGKHGMTIVEPKNADALNTAIGKILNREAGVVVGGRTYESANEQTSDVNQCATISGVVADVIPTIPMATNGDVGPSLVVIGRDGKLDNPSYMPLKDLLELKY